MYLNQLNLVESPLFSFQHDPFLRVSSGLFEMWKWTLWSVWAQWVKKETNGFSHFVLLLQVNMAARDLMARHGQMPGGQFILDPSLRYLSMPYDMGQGITDEPGQYNMQHQEVQQGGGTSGLCKMGRTPSMQRVASLEHLQKRIRSGVSCHSPSWNSYWEMEGPAMVEQHDV